MLVNLGHHDVFDECLSIPARSDEASGKIVEKLLMFWAVALYSEVFGGVNESASEEGLPEAIDDDP